MYVITRPKGGTPVRNPVEVCLNYSHEFTNREIVSGILMQVQSLSTVGNYAVIATFELSFEETLHLAARLLRLVQGVDSPHATPNERIEP